MSEPHWKPRGRIYSWHDYLTVDEKATVAALERQQADARTNLKKASADLGTIRNRAIQRARLAAARAALASPASGEDAS